MGCQQSKPVNEREAIPVSKQVGGLDGSKKVSPQLKEQAQIQASNTIKQQQTHT
jgi:hypothetical protein